MNDIKDYLGHEIHEGDVILYSNKRGEFKEGVITSTKPLFLQIAFYLKSIRMEVRHGRTVAVVHPNLLTS